MSRSLLLILAGSLVGSAASAQGIDRSGLDARGTGRAGTGVVSSDGRAAPWVNPAGLARRGGRRWDLTGLLSHAAWRYQSDRPSPDGEPPAVDGRGAPRFDGCVGAVTPVGERLAIGLVYTTPTLRRFEAAEPAAYDRPPATDGPETLAQRYAASSFRLERRAVGAGAALRALPWLALGAAAHWVQVQASQHRTVWAGLPPARAPRRSVPCEGDRWDKDCDMGLSLDGRDSLVLAGSFGFVLAPEDLPLEVGASLLASQRADLRGGARLRDSRGFGPRGERRAEARVAADATASLGLPLPMIVRGGARVFGSRASLELQAELASLDAPSPAWTVEGVAVERPEGAVRALDRIATGTSLRSALALRAAVDADVVPGFLTVSLGYAFEQSPVPARRLSSALPLVDQHVVALGVEARGEHSAVVLGLSRSFAAPVQVSATETEVHQVAPFASQVSPAAAGRYQSTALQVAVGVELSY